jgi:predicted phage terminase large subunit-like protein
LCALPIRHFKTQSTLHGIIWLLLKDPTRRIIFLTHSYSAAQNRGKRLRDIARQTPVGPTRGYDTIEEWQNDKGGGVVIMSADQSRLGLDCHTLIFDDPLSEKDVDSPEKRDAVDGTIAHYTARCMRYGKPGPVLGVMSRWHPDDPIGRRLSRDSVDWLYIHRPAIIDDDLPTARAFAPDVWDLPELAKVRAELRELDPTERLWWAQFMGDPRPMGSDLFGAATTYSRLPDFGYRIGYGIDLAFTVGEGSDWFARVVGRMYGPKMYLLDCVRHKIDSHLIESTCKADIDKYGYAPIYSYMSGPEVGMAKVLVERGVPVARMRARYSKLVRAQRTIKRWNDNMILVPEGALWVPGFLRRLSVFRGNEKDKGDDEVDALVSLCDGAMGGASGMRVKTLGSRYRGMH